MPALTMSGNCCRQSSLGISLKEDNGNDGVHFLRDLADEILKFMELRSKIRLVCYNEHVALRLPPLQIHQRPGGKFQLMLLYK